MYGLLIRGHFVLSFRIYFRHNVPSQNKIILVQLKSPENRYPVPINVHLRQLILQKIRWCKVLSKQFFLQPVFSKNLYYQVNHQRLTKSYQRLTKDLPKSYLLNSKAIILIEIIILIFNLVLLPVFFIYNQYKMCLFNMAF